MMVGESRPGHRRRRRRPAGSRRQPKSEHYGVTFRTRAPVDGREHLHQGLLGRQPDGHFSKPAGRGVRRAHDPRGSGVPGPPGPPSSRAGRARTIATHPRRSRSCRAPVRAPPHPLRQPERPVETGVAPGPQTLPPPVARSESRTTVEVMLGSVHRCAHGDEAARPRRRFGRMEHAANHGLGFVRADQQVAFCDVPVRGPQSAMTARHRTRLLRSRASPCPLRPPPAGRRARPGITPPPSGRPSPPVGESPHA